VNEIRWSTLPPAWRRFLRWLQWIDCGQILCLGVWNGEPVLEPRPRMFRTVKFGSDRGRRDQLMASDFVLRQEHLEMIEELRRLQNGTVLTLDVLHGLPAKMNVEAGPEEPGR
jgi:hypothetical protein